MVEGAHQNVRTVMALDHFVYFDPFIHFRIEDRLLEMKTLSCPVCAAFSTPMKNAVLYVVGAQ